jgi:hypothetical protein
MSMFFIKHHGMCDRECAICYSLLRKIKLQELPCTHTFCNSCIDTWFKSQATCPMCRKNLMLYSLTRFTRTQHMQKKAMQLQLKFEMRYKFSPGTVFYASEVERLVSSLAELEHLKKPEDHRYCMYPSKGVNVSKMQTRGLYLSVYSDNKRDLQFYMAQTFKDTPLHLTKQSFKIKYGIDVFSTDDTVDFYLLKCLGDPFKGI